MADRPVRLERDGNVAVMVLDNPPLNLFGADAWRALVDCVDEIESSDARAMVWRAEGEVFTGGAENNLFSFARLTRPSGEGVLAALSPFVVLIWVCTKNLLRTLLELGRAMTRLGAHPVRARKGWRWRS